MEPLLVVAAVMRIKRPRPELRDPMFQFAFDNALFELSAQRPALASLFRLPRPWNAKGTRPTEQPIPFFALGRGQAPSFSFGKIHPPHLRYAAVRPVAERRDPMAQSAYDNALSE